VNGWARVDIWAIFTLCWTFVVLHTALSWIEWRYYGAVPWWRSILGWLLTSAVASLGVVFGFAAAASVWPVLATLPWFMWAYLLAVSGIGVVVVGKIVARILLHLRARRLGGDR
jgi:hypothetical protein